MNTFSDFFPLFPEIFLLCATCLVLLIDMFLPDSRRNITYWLSLVTLVVTGVMSLGQLSSGFTAAIFNHMFTVDPLANLFKLASVIAVGVTFVYSRTYIVQRGLANDTLGGEFYPLALFSLLGMFVMISGTNFLTLYLGLELMSLASYALVALARDNSRSIEASMKYFVLGALASGFLLYGMSMLYGATGSLDLHQVIGRILANGVIIPVQVFGVVFIVAGLAFKLGAVPFHMWVPDVYQGAPTAATLLIGGAPKLAAFMMTYRLLVEGLMPLGGQWQQMLTVLAVLSLIIGNVTAIAQTSIKRMLAYSTISHMGFMLLGLLAGIVDENGLSLRNAYSSAAFYALTYVLTTLGTFGVLMLMSRKDLDVDAISDLSGLARRSPWFATVMMILMLSLAGLPPTVGFYAKWSVLQAAFATGQIWLPVLAVVMSLIGAYYYLRIVKVMFFDEPKDLQPLEAPLDMRIVLSLNGITVLALGIFPNGLLSLVNTAMGATLVNYFQVLLHGGK